MSDDAKPPTLDGVLAWIQEQVAQCPEAMSFTFDFRTGDGVVDDRGVDLCVQGADGSVERTRLLIDDDYQAE